ncbi:MAG TPA: HD domain-containing phosphohydrolase [Spirochaetia bacterium]|nr:HD domain-containing phosphohydrolase [Spirochaetia bacterium]
MPASPLPDRPLFPELRGFLRAPDSSAAAVASRLAVAAGVCLETSEQADERWDFILLCAPAGLPRIEQEIHAAVKIYPRIPVIVLALGGAHPDDSDALYRAGAADLLSEDASPAQMHTRIANCVDAFRYRRSRLGESIPYDEEVRNAIGEIILREFETLYVLGKVSEYKDRETGSHIARVAYYSRLIARMIGESEANQELLFHASALHDIGKVGIPDAILLKAGNLVGVEWDVMRGHTTNGHGMLKESHSSYLLTGAMISLTHHEKFDGTGYPIGLRGQDIPLYGRIVGVADVFDALTTERPYKAAWTIEAALDYLRTERGRHFDPLLVDAFVYNAHVVRDIFSRHQDAVPSNLTTHE